MQRPLTPNSCYHLVPIFKCENAESALSIQVGVEFATFMSETTLPSGCVSIVDQPFLNSWSDPIISMMDIAHVNVSHSNITLPSGSRGVFEKWSDKGFNDEYIIDIVSSINAECCENLPSFFKALNGKLKFRYAFMRWKNASVILRRYIKRLHRFAALHALSSITEESLREMIVTRALLY